jgi:hypothetical protein
MTNDEGMTEAEFGGTVDPLVIRASAFIRHSSFVLRHSALRSMTAGIS